MKNQSNSQIEDSVKIFSTNFTPKPSPNQFNWGSVLRLQEANYINKIEKNRSKPIINSSSTSAYLSNLEINNSSNIDQKVSAYKEFSFKDEDCRILNEVRIEIEKKQILGEKLTKAERRLLEFIEFALFESSDYLETSENELNEIQNHLDRLDEASLFLEKVSSYVKNNS